MDNNSAQKQNVQGRANGKYAKMRKCACCKKRAAIWPDVYGFFGGDICGPCSASKPCP